MSKARAAIRAFLELDSEGRAHFDQLREELNGCLRLADMLPDRHPNKASHRWDAVRRFKERHDL
jgi:hypothetical protein